MSDIMKPIPFAELMQWVLTEYENQKTIFGVGDIYRHKADKMLPIFTEQIETPFGPAAGPHTQLAQNLIAAYAGGSRFFEVKTVQIIDGEDLPVSKPCIAAEDECYNVEWSTELRVPQAFEEYVKAWFALKLLSKALGLGSENGFVFNMSVGYDLKGIQSEKINTYIEGMKDASNSAVWQECTAWAKQNLYRLNLDEEYVNSINPHVCTSITLSTLHGCPPDEIERIATYLISEKKLNTYIKCNPTLLGYEFARKTMDDMGYDYLVFDDHHFKADLQFADAEPMFRRLLELAASNGVEFGVKLTNTFPVTIAAGELPGEEMYMSGKSLYPLSISLAEKIEKAFDGKLRVSYSGGADWYNIDKIYSTGIWPITLATTLLKPGGYNRLKPMAEKLAALPYTPFDGVNVNALTSLSAEAKQDAHHVKPVKPSPVRKMNKSVPLTDCFVAACSEGCPIGQDIPAYLDLVTQGKYAEALAVICEKNPLPFITGTICSHRCQSKCTRNFYEEPVQIRAAKLKAAQGGMDEFLQKLTMAEPRSENVAIIGGGPAGMSAAYMLARAGAKATIFEKRNALGGIVRHVIPQFRISNDVIEQDAALLEKLGVTVNLNTTVNDARTLLAEGYTHVIIAVGAWQHGKLELEGCKPMNVLAFLEKQKTNPDALSLGKNVVIIGGGNTAMDAARAAKRCNGVENVRLVYRRTKRYMPADAEELALAVADGVEFCELLAPVKFACGNLVCDVMQLGAPDAGGRRSPVSTGRTANIPADTVISAVGEKTDAAFYLSSGLHVDEKGKAKTNEALCAADGIYVVGDANRGPSTVVEAIADAATAVTDILSSTIKDIPYYKEANVLKAKRGTLAHCTDAAKEANRCLGCSVVCENCVDVCPNRANLAVSVPGMAKEQVVHIDKMCNECGNCLVFCPYSSAPYKEKFTVFATENDFDDSENSGFTVLDHAGETLKVRLGTEVYTAKLDEDTRLTADLKAIIKTILHNYSYCL